MPQATFEQQQAVVTPEWFVVENKARYREYAIDDGFLLRPFVFRRALAFEMIAILA